MSFGKHLRRNLRNIMSGGPTAPKSKSPKPWGMRAFGDLGFSTVYKKISGFKMKSSPAKIYSKPKGKRTKY